MKRNATKAAIFLLTTFAITASAQNPAGRRAVPEGIKVLTDLAYVADGHARQKLDLYLPEKADGPLPVVVWIHGGAWRAGSKEGCPGIFLVPKGFAVVSVGLGQWEVPLDEVFPPAG